MTENVGDPNAECKREPEKINKGWSESVDLGDLNDGSTQKPFNPSPPVLLIQKIYEMTPNRRVAT